MFKHFICQTPLIKVISGLFAHSRCHENSMVKFSRIFVHIIKSLVRRGWLLFTIKRFFNLNPDTLT
ncbi:Uncharacterised protein [Mycobacterium tuberculosis]|nr:Uncharacterised protein [Mycobacterium tuberculosis]